MKGFKKYLLTLLISVSIFLVGVNYVNAEGTAGEILLTKTATKEDKEKGRSADVTLTVNANGFTTVDKIDVVLVLDRSTSMDGTSMKNTKKAANDLVNLLITDKTKDNTRAAIVTYGSDLLTSYTSNSLTNDATALKNTINSIPNSMDNQGTNVHAGLIKAEELLKNSGDDTQKIVILLSDGEPTYYIGTDNKRHGMGGSDNYENDYCSWNYRKNIGECTEYRDSKNVVMTYDYDFFSTIYTTKDAYKPSTNTNNKATTMKADGTKIYTIGFGNGASGNAYEFLGKVASTPTDKYRYTASDYAGLKKAFNKIVNDFTTVATDAVVTDIVPKGFTIKEGTLPAGATAVENKDGTTTITWVIGDVKSTATNSLTYTVEAKEGHYGSMYTNVSATINANSVDGNPKYGSSNPISLDFDKPYVPIPGVTVEDDYYDIKQGTTFTTPVGKYILDNDKLSDLHEDENATVTNEIVLVYDGTTNGKAENITLNQDGSFSYNATKDTLGKITYKYYVKTTVTIGNVTEVVKSNTTTITLNVIKNQTTYVINYLEKGTNKALIKEVNGTGNVYDEITLTSVKENITGYVYDSVSIDPLVLSDNTKLNVMNIYYTKRTDLSYTVNYLEKDTNKVLNKSKEVKNVEFETVINASDEIIPIDGYVFNSVNPEKLTITTGSNVINIYYTKRTDLSYTVNYLEKDTNKVLNKSKEVKNVEFETVINASDEIIPIDGYVFNSVNPEKLTITTGSNVINIYYTKRTDLSYTVNYLEKDTNKVLNKSKEVKNVEFETVINASDEIIPIDGYVFNSVNPEKLTITTGSNVINIYYTKRTDLSYTVNYLEKDTNKVLNKSKEVKNVEFEKVINASDEIIPIDGYVFNSVNPEKLTITTGSNVINIYYTKRTDLSYTVNYLEKDTNKVLNESKEVKNVKFETVINASDEIIPIDGYVFNSVNPEKLTITTGSNVINIYYTKRTDLSYTVNYLEKDTNKVLNESKEVKNVKFETLINASDEIIPIDGYVFNSVNPEKLTITTGSNVINIYYTKRNDLSYTVNYLEKDTNKVLNESKEVNNVEFEKVINASDEIIAIDGYKFVFADKNTIVIDTENNEINLYYEAVNGTVKSIYVDKDGNEISESVITEGRVGTEYKTSSKEISKYYLVETIGEETGSYSEEEIVITYVYDLVPVTGIDMNSNSSYMFIGTFGLALVILFVRKKRYN